MGLVRHWARWAQAQDGAQPLPARLYGSRQAGLAQYGRPNTTGGLAGAGGDILAYCASSEPARAADWSASFCQAAAAAARRW